MKRVLMAVAAVAVAAACSNGDNNGRQSAMAERNVTGGAYDSVLDRDTTNPMNKMAATDSLTRNDSTQRNDSAAVSGGSAAQAALIGQVEAADRMEVQTAEVALRNSKSTAVKNLAQMIRSDHQANLSQSEQLAKNLNVTPVPPNNAAAEQSRAVDSLDALSGASFDSAYVDMMIKGHQEKIDQLKAAEPQNGQVKSFVDQTLPVLQKHLKAAKDAKGKLGS
jgi:putative membrane protein